MLHLSVVMLIFLRAITMPTENFAIRDAIRVDVVDLPDKIAQLPAPQATPPTPPKAAEPKPQPKPAEPVKAPPKPNAPAVDLRAKKDLSKAQREAMNRLKAMEALEKIKGEVSKEKAPKPQPVVKGNAVSAGNALSGLEKIDYDQYWDQIKSKVFTNWSIPSWMADAQLKATVNVQIDEHGFVTKKTIRHSSGNEIFDNRCIQAVEASSPFAPPPERLRGMLSTSGINFNFPQ
jgi:colicin import membrane protein